MLKRANILLIVLILLINLIPDVSAEALNPESLISEAACLMDAETGQVLFEKSMHTKMYPASITKIATCIVALENADLSDVITMSDNAVFSVGRDASHISLVPGEQLTLNDALHAAMLMSANDACNGIAEHVSGTIEEFAKLMTETARRAGAINTRFNNANGLKDPEHYTTAYDMAMITRYALKNPVFTKLFGTFTYEMPPNNKQPESRPFANQHSMIGNNEFKYDGIIGGKAGYTTVALYTLVTAAERNGRKLIAVVMKSPRVNDKYKDTIKLLDYGFDEFKNITFTESEIKDKLIDPGLTVPEDGVTVSVLSSVDKSDIGFELSDGRVALSLKNEIPGMYPVLGGFDAEVPETVTAMSETSIPEKPSWLDILVKILKVIGIIAGILIGLIILLLIVLYIRRSIIIARRRRRRRRRRR